MLPKEIQNKKIYKLDYFQKEDLIKNLELNKLIELIRSSFFDRESINTNINLTTKEQSKFYKEMNKRLNSLLVVDTKKVRGREYKKNNLNVSFNGGKIDYDKFFNDKDEKIEAPLNIKLNLKNNPENPIKEIMRGYREVITYDNQNENEEKNKEILETEKRPILTT